jgi:hypothetical protein
MSVTILELPAIELLGAGSGSWPLTGLSKLDCSQPEYPWASSHKATL